MPDALHDLAVEDVAENLLLEAVRPDNGARRATAAILDLVVCDLSRHYAAPSARITSSPGFTCRS